MKKIYPHLQESVNCKMTTLNYNFLTHPASQNFVAIIGEMPTITFFMSDNNKKRQS